MFRRLIARIVSVRSYAQPAAGWVTFCGVPVAFIGTDGTLTTAW